MKPPTRPTGPAPAAETIRLNKFLAHAGVASRRAADEMIVAGRVQVNGRVVREMGVQIDPRRDLVTCDGQPVKLPEAEPVTILLNKPPGYLSTREDPEDRSTVFDLVPPEFQKLYPVGRLDLNSEGLMLLSNDGDLTYRLTHPSFEHEKEYIVLVKGPVPLAAIAKLKSGVMIDDGMASARVRYLERIPPPLRSWLEPKPQPSDTWLAIVLHEGRKRQIRQMCEAVKLDVLRLVRVRIGEVELGDLQPGQWRRPSKRQSAALSKVASRQGNKETR